ncbi:Inherit from NOG: Methyltransferase FkbM [Seminavis robusta]|uniref:Inherit from NOG: Methyltransferase FkbM n=1 Tax=Seminavis robusta TaxID=568900 RepID=A0A9N8DH18_9STRA|nr:Inherit from NOG: Methyltransferase FkbM [Seminavis robusta]|eukprot:Sro82_g044140.1 Inherit from NOG: Methyltransferase FkbM (307) ;mRNA; r:125718-126638
MVAPRRNLSKDGLSSWPSFAAGLAVGCLLMFLCLGQPLPPPESSSSLLNVNNNNLRMLESQQLIIGQEEPDNGWHTINVWYHDRKALGQDLQKPSYGQVHQDEIILDLIGDAGYFIDLAANDALEFSNTLVLERHNGWHGLCIEPNPTYWYGLAHRKCTVVGALMGGEQIDQVNVKFRGVFGGIVGKMDGKLANRKKEPQAPTEQRYTVPISKVLQRYQVPKTIDYLNLDIEGAEFLVMQHFPFDTYKVRVMTVERPNEQLHALLESKGYHHLKDLTWWGETLWAHESSGFTKDHPKIVKIPYEGK